MKKYYAKDFLCGHLIGEKVDMYGWVKARRNHSQIVFLDIADSTGFIQVVVDGNGVGAEIFELSRRIVPESAVKITGCLMETGRQRPPFREIRAQNIEVIGCVDVNISPRPHSNLDIFDPRFIEQLLNKRHLYLRNERIAAILRFRHRLTSIVHQWFRINGFMEIHAPVLTPTPLYDDNTPIPVSIHGQDVYLTQCVGFYLEQAVHAFERIYNIGPSFRAEESRSKRHLMEYWHIKAELAFVDLEDLFAVVEQFIHDVTQQCMSQGSDLVKIIGTEMCQDGLNIPFPRIDYGDAVELLRSQNCDIEFGMSLGSQEEALLSERFKNTPFWVVGIPRTIEPFPYVIDETDCRRTKTADLIASNGFGELLGIAEKIHTLSMLDKRLNEKGKAGDLRYDWLRELRQYGCVPHGGFGMGMERLIRWLLGIPHVRDTIPFHRVFGRRIYP